MKMIPHAGSRLWIASKADGDCRILFSSGYGEFAFLLMRLQNLAFDESTKTLLMRKTL